jgi:hypothetical protein
MKIGDWVLYEATHQGSKEKRLGKVRWVEPTWLDVTWHWTDSVLDDPHSEIFFSTTVVRKYCTVLTDEVAQIFLTANKEK